MRGKWFWGIIILAIVSLLLSLFGPWNAKARSVAMGQTISNALSGDQYKGVNVEMSGNVATLSGEVASQELADEAARVAASTECENCDHDARVWHKVRNNLTVKSAPAMPVVSPYVFSARKADDGHVLLNGYVRDEAERERVLQQASTLFPGKVVNQKVKIASGAPDVHWGDVIGVHMPELASLDFGGFVIEDGQVLIEGQTRSVDTRSRINGVAENLTQSFSAYNGAANIRVPDTKAENAGEVKSASICQDLLASLKGDNRINFTTNSAEITGAHSFDLLNLLSSAVLQCKSFNVTVEGHTDNVGAAKYNQWLSEARANSVVAYLADNGVEASRLKAVGFGETKPVDTNDTPQGRAQNRRIEFKILTSE